ncbi:hypothetical protein [Gracilimonas mengyeensis]|uniref:Uncharacterized protein n=1 Tax=Gracilimonas mengyeensis TaxID=1302730 RepID=A0A521C3J8_9BACT|nr:hypothetical protein [Gracilimonas mengyeensis]SMO54056.1 hypothetical protein SAMN06265219_104132 [Gracilimonas mengyeensis]
MRILLIIISIIGLMLTIIPSILVFTQNMTLETHKQLMATGMILWFGTAVFWIEGQD